VKTSGRGPPLWLQPTGQGAAAKPDTMQQEVEVGCVALMLRASTTAIGSVPELRAAKVACTTTALGGMMQGEAIETFAS
jgi:hypothetical protein